MKKVINVTASGVIIVYAVFSLLLTIPITACILPMGTGVIWFQVVLPIAFVLFAFSFAFFVRGNCAVDIVMIILAFFALTLSIVGASITPNFSVDEMISGNFLSLLTASQTAARVSLLSSAFISVSIFLLALPLRKSKKVFARVFGFSVFFAINFLIDLSNFHLRQVIYTIMRLCLSWSRYVYLIVISVLSLLRCKEICDGRMQQ